MQRGIASHPASVARWSEVPHQQAVREHRISLRLRRGHGGGRVRHPELARPMDRNGRSVRVAHPGPRTPAGVLGHWYQVVRRGAAREAGTGPGRAVSRLGNRVTRDRTGRSASGRGSGGPGGGGDRECASLYRSSVYATRLRDQVLGVVAHDLRNPLSAILMQTSALMRQGRELERPSPKPLEVIHRAAARIEPPDSGSPRRGAHGGRAVDHR